MIRESYKFGWFLRSKIIPFSQLKVIINEYFSNNKIYEVEILHKTETIKGVSFGFKNTIPIRTEENILSMSDRDITLSFEESNFLKLAEDSNILSDLINDRIYLLDSSAVIVFHKVGSK